MWIIRATRRSVNSVCRGVITHPCFCASLLNLPLSTFSSNVLDRVFLLPPLPSFLRIIYPRSNPSSNFPNTSHHIIEVYITTPDLQTCTSHRHVEVYITTPSINMASFTQEAQPTSTGVVALDFARNTLSIIMEGTLSRKPNTSSETFEGENKLTPQPSRPRRPVQRRRARSSDHAPGPHHQSLRRRVPGQ